jgi:molybdopterin/thiamine biosynthesis adenylyltransferase
MPMEASAEKFVIPEKYSRQVLFAPIGPEGQERLCRAKVVIIGCGALGATQASMLARAGVGKLRIIDRDYVEESNLQRQILFDESDAAQRLPKAVAAEQKLRQINTDVQAEGVIADVQATNVEDLIGGFDLILDGTDNFETRFLLNDAAVKHGIPWIYGAVVSSYGITFTILPDHTACLSCLLPSCPVGLQETCDTMGVIGPAVSWVSTLQVSEALKILTGHKENLHGKLLSFDIWQNCFQQLTLSHDPACRTCGMREFHYLEGEAPTHISMCGRNSVQIHQRDSRQLDLAALRERLAQFGPVQWNAYLVQCRLDPYEFTVFQDGRAIIKGTQDHALARSLYARYVGS